MSTKKADRKKHQQGALTKKADWKSTKKAGCTGVYSAVPNVPTPNSELVKNFHGVFYDLGQSAHRQRTIFRFDIFLSLFDNHFESGYDLLLN
jgi:hypothetical protein